MALFEIDEVVGAACGWVQLRTGFVHLIKTGHPLYQPGDHAARSVRTSACRLEAAINEQTRCEQGGV